MRQDYACALHTPNFRLLSHMEAACRGGSKMLTLGSGRLLVDVIAADRAHHRLKGQLGLDGNEKVAARIPKQIRGCIQKIRFAASKRQGSLIIDRQVLSIGAALISRAQGSVYDHASVIG